VCRKTHGKTCVECARAFVFVDMWTCVCVCVWLGMYTYICVFARRHVCVCACGSEDSLVNVKMYKNTNIHVDMSQCVSEDTPKTRNVHVYLF